MITTSFSSAASSSPVLFDSQPMLLVETTQEFNSIPCTQQSAVTYLQTAEKAADSSLWICVLPEDGSEQVTILAGKLKTTSFSFDQVFSSPSKLALQTSNLLKETLAPSIEISTNENLNKRRFGYCEGATGQDYASIERKEEKEIPLLKAFDEKFAFKANPEMESLKEVNRRASNFILEHHAAGKANLMVTHHAVIKALFMAAIAQQRYDIEYHDFELANYSILILEANNSGEINIKAVEGLKFQPRYSSFVAMRHEKTAQNERSNWNIPDTAPLSTIGIEGANNLAMSIQAKRITFDRAFTSATVRAWETMNRVLQTCSPEIKINQDPELAEITMSYERDVKPGDFVGVEEFLNHGKQTIMQLFQNSESDIPDDLLKLKQLIDEGQLEPNHLFQYKFDDQAETYAGYSEHFLKAFYSHLTLGERTVFCVHSSGMKAILSRLKPENDTFDSICRAKTAPGSWIRGRVYGDGTMLLIDSSSGITVP